MPPGATLGCKPQGFSLGFDNPGAPISLFTCTRRAMAQFRSAGGGLTIKKNTKTYLTAKMHLESVMREVLMLHSSLILSWVFCVLAARSAPAKSQIENLKRFF